MFILLFYYWTNNRVFAIVGDMDTIKRYCSFGNGNGGGSRNGGGDSMPKFVELQEKDKVYEEKQNNCQSDRSSCRFEGHEVDLYQYRLRIVRCTKHGEIYGRNIVRNWR